MTSNRRVAGGGAGMQGERAPDVGRINGLHAPRRRAGEI